MNGDLKIFNFERNMKIVNYNQLKKLQRGWLETKIIDFRLCYFVNILVEG